MNTMASRLRLYRKSLGLTQEELALKAGIAQEFISGIEKGRKRPSVEVLEKLCGALGCSLLRSCLVGVVGGPATCVGLLLGVVGGPCLGVGLFLSVSSMCLRGGIVTSGRVTVLSVRGGSNGEEADGECEPDECFHGCVSGS